MSPVLCIFAKAPLPGLAKTRLHTRYSADEAAVIATVLLHTTVERCVTIWPGPVELWVSPDATHAVFKDLVSRYALTIQIQPDGHLGTRMQAALSTPRAGTPPVALIGSDVPHAPPSALKSAYVNLKDGLNVFAPASDGGFWFYGLHSPRLCGFDSVDWAATGSVAEQTLASASERGIQFDLVLDELDDIDTPQDLDRVTQVDTLLGNAVRRALG